jgi:hypothetical protein
MYQDKLLTFSDSQAVTAAAASTDSIDFGAARDLGVGENLYLVSVCEVAMTDSGSDSTLAVALETDTTSTITPDATKTMFTFPAASAAGTVLIAKLSPGDLNMRYAQLRYTPANGNLSTGTFTSFLTHNVDKYTAYADNIQIS